MTLKEIAEAFSNGKFELTFPHLAENVHWNVIDENYFEGKKSVIENCEKVAEYFKSVETNFKTINVISERNKVVIAGTAEFIRDGERLNFVSSCDLYEFNEDAKLKAITSYCIVHRTRKAKSDI